MNVGHLAAALAIMFVFAVSLLNPGGAAVAVFFALVVLAVVVLVPFVQEYVLAVNKGKAARKSREMADQRDNGGKQ